MTVSRPRFALGVKIPNPTFQLVDKDSPGKAAGWTIPSAGLTSTSRYEVLGDGHVRTQRFARSATGTSKITSGYSPANVANGSSITPWTVPIVYRTPGNTGADIVRVYHAYYDSDGSLLWRELVKTITGETAEWTLDTCEHELGYLTDHFFHGVEIELQSSGAATLDLRFAGLGLYDGISGNDPWYEADRQPTHPGIYGVPEKVDGDNVDFVASAMGRRFRLSRARNAKRFRLNLPFEHVPKAQADVLNWLWSFNKGENFDQGSVNPTAGTYPILVFPGHTGLPAALYGDMEGRTAPMVQSGARWFDPPVFDGQIEIVEDVS